jgi:hypothetical protein
MKKVSSCTPERRTYSASCSVPVSHWKTEKDGVGHLMIVFALYIGSDGSILWDKDIISKARLKTYMQRASALNPVPQMILEVSPSAPCSTVEAVRGIMDAAPMCKGPHSKCSEGWNWKQWPVMGGP